MSNEPERGPRLPPRWFIRLAWSVHRGLYRVTRGRVGLRRPRGNRWGTLRFTATGRRTGRKHSVIIAYLEDGPNLIAMAMNGWADGEPAWWLNLQAHPDASVDLVDGPRLVRARVAKGGERSRLWGRWPGCPIGCYSARVRECRGRLAPDDRRGLVDELVILEGLHHEQGKVHAARDVALENGVTHVPAPHGQALALALLEVAAAHDGPPRVAGEHPPARLHLVVEVGEASQTRERAKDLHDRLELPRVHVLAVARDVPPAREHQARARRRMVQHRLGRSRRVPVDASRDQHDEHPVAPGDRSLDGIGVVRRSRHDRDAAGELVQLVNAFLPAHADNLVAAIERVPHHVAPELAGGPDDAHLRGVAASGVLHATCCFSPRGFLLVSKSPNSGAARVRARRSCLSRPAGSSVAAP